MSGIAGIFCRDGRPVSEAPLRHMLGVLAHRGGDEDGRWCKEHVGLVQQVRYTTPEARHEQLPLLGPDRRRVLVADARIDNRQELIATLRINKPASEIADGELILAAYATWGEACPKRLIGAFAFAIWDDRNETLFCARDPVGVKPFYYYQSDDVFVFASEIKGVLCVDSIPRQLNEVQVAHYLTQNRDDKEATFYKHIRRLPPAQSFVVRREKTRQHTYWSFDPGRELCLSSDDEYAEAFREVFDEAVRCRMRSPQPVGVLLSGGLDSSSVACVMRELRAREDDEEPVHTFSSVYPSFRGKALPKMVDELPFIEAVLAQGGFTPHFSELDQISPLVDVEKMLWHIEQPLDIFNFHSAWLHFKKASRLGVSALLDGAEGDITISHGETYLAALVHNRQWERLAHEARTFVQNSTAQGTVLQPERMLYRYGGPYFKRLAREKQGSRFVRDVWNASRHFDVSPWRFAIDHDFKSLFPTPVQRVWDTFIKRNGYVEADGAAEALIHPDLARRTGVEVEACPPEHVRSRREGHVRSLEMGMISYILEVIDKGAHAFGVESRHPFYDRRLMEFCLALPSEQILKDGWSRWILRYAMDGVLPPEVQWRMDKAEFGRSIAVRLRAFEQERVRRVMEEHRDRLARYVNVNFLQEKYATWKADIDDTASGAEVYRSLFLATNLALWLEKADVET